MIEYILGLLPAIITGIVLFYAQRRQRRRDEATDRRAEARRKESMLSMHVAFATLKLSEATAIAVRDGKTNGELKAAMAEGEAAKNEYYEFLNDEAYRGLTG